MLLFSLYQTFCQLSVEFLRKKNKYQLHAILSPHPLQFIIPPHFLIQLLLHSVKEVSTAMALASSDVGIETIAVLGFNAEELVHGLLAPSP